ncbi:MAG TPA: RNA polymerase sigma factor [Candidatus Binataceae bacterium]|nr:RNA polymerase sigma factor [Candidatus Binataceae bacterium]
MASEGFEPDRSQETTRSDAELISESLLGDGSAFAELASRHRRYVNNLCHRFFRDPEIVRDLAQESFTKAFSGLASYRAEMPFAGWLRAIVINVCYDELRRRQRRPEELVGSFSPSECSWLDLVSDATPEQIVAAAEERNEAHNLAHRLLAMLKPEDRMVLVLKDSEDLSVAEIAAHMGWSEAKVKIRAFRARRLLRKQAERILEGRRTRSRSGLL